MKYIPSQVEKGRAYLGVASVAALWEDEAALS
jgi:hypothetical protein